MTERTQHLVEMCDDIEQDLNLVVVYNPFDVRNQGRYKLVWDAGAPLTHYLDGLDMDEVRWGVTLNGELIESGRFATTVPVEGDFLVLVPVPLGGGGGKQILRMVAMLAVTVVAAIVAPGIGGALAASGFGTAVGMSAAVGTAIVTATIGIAGSLLVNTLIPPPKVKNKETQNSADSPTYGIDGAKNTSTEDIVVPVLYGEHRVAGNILNSAVLNDGDTQYLTMMVGLSEGPIEDVITADTLINDQPIANFSSVQIDWRRGDPTQTVMDWFEDTVVPVNRQVKLTTTFLDHQMLNVADRVRLDLVFTEGLYRIEPRFGNKETLSVTIEYQYRLVGSTGAWTAGTPVTISAAQRTALRRSIQFDLPVAGKYDIKIRRTTAERANEGGTKELNSDKVWLSDVNEIVLNDVAYNYTAYVGLRIKLTDQLGGIPTVTFRVKGRRVRNFDSSGLPTAEAYSNNPALVALDALTNTRYGGGMALSRFDIQRFMEWRDICTAKGLEFNGPFDSNGNVWDALQDVLRCGRAQMIASGTRYSVAIETPAAASMMFGMGNIKKGTFALNWLSMEDRANEIEVTYYDRANNWERNTLRVVDDQAIARGEPQRLASVHLPGVTSYNTAYLEGWMQLMMNRYIRQTATWEAPLEAIAVTIGDIVIVQHDMPQWGYAGRIEPGSSMTVAKLDRPVTMAAGKNYRFLCHHAATKIANVTVRGVNGKSILIDHRTEEQPPSRAIWSGKEVRVSRRVTGSPYDTLYLDDVAGLAAGSIIEIWTTDFIDEVPVAGVTGEFTQLTLGSSLRQIPTDYSNFMFGEVGKVKKPFRVRAIGYSDDHHRQITAIEYNESVYEDPLNAVPTPNYSSLTTAVPQISVREITEAPAGDKMLLSIGWNAPTGVIYNGADIYIGLNGEPLGQVGSVSQGATFWTYLVDPTDTVDIRVVTVLEDGRKAIYFQAPITHYAVGGTRGGRVIEAPVNIAVQPFLVSTASGSRIAMNVTWEHPGRVTATDTYRVSYRFNTSDFFQAGTFNDLSAPIYDTLPGTYEIKIVAFDRYGNASPPALFGYVLDAINYINLIAITNLRLINQVSANVFATADAEFAWDAPTDIPLFKAFKIDILNTDNSVRRSEYWPDARYTYTLAKNKADGAGTPARSFKIRVQAVNTANQSSLSATLSVSNPAPALPTGVTATGLFRLIEFRFTAPTEDDYRGVLVWRATTPGFTPADANLVSDGADTLVAMPALPATTYYLRYAAYDAFGKSGLTVSGEISATTVGIVHADLVGQIVDASNLLPSLSTRIDQIDTAGTGLIDKVATLTTNLGTTNSNVSTEITNRTTADTALGARIDAVVARSSGFNATLNYQFDTTVEGWTGTGVTLAWQAGGTVRATASTIDPQMFSPAGLTIDGSVNRYVKAKITRIAGSGWDGTVFYVTSGHAISSAFRAKVADPNLATGASTVVEWDMHNLTAGAADWKTSTITQIRIDLGSTTADIFDIEWIAVGIDGPAASTAAVVSAMNVAAGATSAQASRIDTLYAKVEQIQFRDAFEGTITDFNTNWTTVNQDGGIALVANGETGLNVVQVGDNAGDDSAWIVGKRLIPFDPNRLYKISVRLRRPLGSGAGVYLGFDGVAADGTTKVAADGTAGSTAGAHWVAGSGLIPTTAWTTYVGYLKGYAAAGVNGTAALKNDPTLPGALYYGAAGATTPVARFIRPVIAVNWSALAGRVEIDLVTIEYADTEAAVQVEASARSNATGAIEAKYTVKVDVNGYVSGFGLISTANTATPTSDFIVSADRFAIAKPGTGGLASPVVPFIVSTKGSAPVLSFAGYASIDRLLTGTLDTETLYVGATNVIVDGPTRAIRVNDGTRDRVRLGKQLDNSYGITIVDGAGNTILSSGSGLGAGVVAAVNLAAGSGVNSLYNSDAQFNTDGWLLHSENVAGTPTMGRNLDAGNTIPGTGLIWWQVPSGGTASGNVFDVANVGQNGFNNRYPVIAGRRYEASGLAGVWRATGVNVYIQWYNAAGAPISESHGNQVTNQGGFNRLDQLGLTSVFATAPTGAVTALVAFRVTCNATANPVGMVTRAYFGEAGVNQTEPSAWAPGPSPLGTSGVSGLGALATANSVNWNTQIVNIPAFGNFAYLSSITSANISTYIAGAAIGTAYIADAAITNAKINDLNVSKLTAGYLDAYDILIRYGNLRVIDSNNGNINRVWIGHRSGVDYGFWLWNAAGVEIFGSSGLNGTFIQNLTVDRLAIKDNAINGVKIEDLATSNSNAGEIGQVSYTNGTTANMITLGITTTGQPLLMQFNATVFALSSGSTFKILVDGVDVTGAQTPNGGMILYTKRVALAAGAHTVVVQWFCNGNDTITRSLLWLLELRK